jgi:hypothetical protein
MHNLYYGKRPKIWATPVIFKKLPKVKNRPKCENSPKVVTLILTVLQLLATDGWAAESRTPSLQGLPTVGKYLPHQSQQLPDLENA